MKGIFIAHLQVRIHTTYHLETPLDLHAHLIHLETPLNSQLHIFLDSLNSQQVYALTSDPSFFTV